MKMWYSCIRWVVMVSWREIIWDEHLDCRNSNVSFTSLNHLPNATAPADPPDHRRADTVSVSLSILFHRYTQFIIHYLFMKCHALCLIGVLLQIFKWMIEANIKRFSLLPVVWHLQPTKLLWVSICKSAHELGVHGKSCFTRVIIEWRGAFIKVGCFICDLIHFININPFEISSF